MLCTRGILQSRRLYGLDRGFSIASALQLKSVDKLVMKFLVNNNKSKKGRVWHQSNLMRYPSELAQKQRKGEKNTHRLHVLNNAFQKKICDLLSTGEISSLCSDYRLEISKVRVLPDIAGINVYWVCSGPDKDNRLEKALCDSAHEIRRELNNQHFIGKVPPIHFIKDQRYFELMEVEKQLATIDFGEDFETTDPSHHAEYLVLRKEFSNEVQRELGGFEEGKTLDVFHQALTLASSSSSEREEPVNDLPFDVPAMKNNILGVNTDKIFTKVRQNMVKARAEHRRSSTKLPHHLTTATSNFDQETNFLKTSSRIEEIRKWAGNYKKQIKDKGKRRNKDVQLSYEDSHTYISYGMDDVYKEEEDYFDEEN